jgi:uncharacterized protein YggL (DUF469 family)
MRKRLWEKLHKGEFKQFGLEEWFKKQPLISDYQVGPLKDAWVE